MSHTGADPGILKGKEARGGGGGVTAEFSSKKWGGGGGGGVNQAIALEK